MRLFQRQDALLLAGLTVALLIIFSPSMSRLLDFVREVERERGLVLLPALLVLVGVFAFHWLQTRFERQAQEAAAHVADAAAAERRQDLDRLIAFGQGLARAQDYEAIRGAVDQHLARLAGTERVWVLLRQGAAWEVLAGDTGSAEEMAAREELAERVLGDRAREADSGGTETMGFPLVVGASPIGLLGVRPKVALDPARRRALDVAAALVAVSIKNAQLFREVRENSMRDPLTGCVMRTYAAEVVDAELRRARRSQLPVSLVLFDLDHFKQINDRYGHLCGDAVLAAIGRCMRDVLRGSDLKCRYGGEEFLVLLPETPLSGARRVAETLRREIAERPLLWAGQSLHCTASFGLTQALPGESNIQAIVARADAALYRAKEEGRNCVRLASDTLFLIGEPRKPGVAG